MSYKGYCQNPTKVGLKRRNRHHSQDESERSWEIKNAAAPK